MRHKQQLSTRSYFINRFGKLSTSFLFYQMQDIAWEHADKLGFGYNALKKHQQFWVLSRLLVKIKRRPEWGEDFTLETWSRGTDGFFGYRDFSFVDSQGHPIVKGTSSWLVLDLKSKRIVRLNDFGEFPHHDESVFENNAQKVMPPKTNEALTFSDVLFTEIDINQHMNSGRYLERIINSYDSEFHKTHELVEFEVNFLKEGMAGDQLAVKKQEKDPLNHLCSVVRKSDGIDLVRVRLLWEMR